MSSRVILGGGVSGLSLAFYLKEKHPLDSLLLLEKQSCLGGVIGSFHDKEISFETGPKTFKLSSAHELIDLIKKLDLEDKMIFSSQASSKRWIFYEGKFHEVGFSFRHLRTQPLMRMALWALIKEPFFQKVGPKDETVEAFFLRRLGKDVTRLIVDPFVKGICGNSIKELSIKACFPKLKKWEMQYGSILKGAFLEKSKKEKPSLFSLEGGLSRLIQSLSSHLTKEIQTEQPVIDVIPLGKKYKVITANSAFETQIVYSTLDPMQMKDWTLFSCFREHPFFNKISYVSLSCVSFAFEKKSFPLEGFGYLVPSCAHEPILGVMIDSHLFKREEKYDRITVMLGEDFSDQEEEKLYEVALKTLERHLGLKLNPLSRYIFKYSKALVKYPVEHKAIVHDMQELADKYFPNVILAGHYQHPPGVNHCIKYSKEIASEEIL